MALWDLVFGPFAATCLLGITTIALLFWISTRKQQYWKKKGIPYLPPLPIVGSFHHIITQPLQDVELERYLKYGRIYGHYEGNRPLLSVAEPDLLRDILVKDFQVFTGRRSFSLDDKIAKDMLTMLNGEDWKRVRTIVTPTFTTGKIKRMMNIFRDCSQTLVGNFKKATEKGEYVDAKRVYGAFTMDIIASSAFSSKIDSHNDPDNKFVKTARDVFKKNVNWRIVLFALCPGFMKLFKISIFTPSVMKFFCDVTYQIIEERKRTGQTRNDFLQLLLDTAKDVAKEEKLENVEKEIDDIARNYGKEEINDQTFKNVSKQNLSLDEIVAQCVIFFLAGYDTTASTLSFASYLLALNEDVQDKLRTEVDEALKESKGELTYEATQSMKYLDSVISETLRMYPPSARIERQADDDYKLGDTGIILPKGMLVSIPVYAIHRDPEYFPEPEKFDPERFSPEEKAKRSQYAYLPFGAGPRNCVGMRFALMEIKVCLIHVISTFKIKKCPETKVPLEFYTGQSLLQPKNITVSLEVRKDCPLKS